MGLAVGVCMFYDMFCFVFFFQAEDGIRDLTVTGVQTCALPIYPFCGCSARRYEQRAPRPTRAIPIDPPVRPPGPEPRSAVLLLAPDSGHDAALRKLGGCIEEIRTGYGLDANRITRASDAVLREIHPLRIAQTGLSIELQAIGIGPKRLKWCRPREARSQLHAGDRRHGWLRFRQGPPFARQSRNERGGKKDGD